MKKPVYLRTDQLSPEYLANLQKVGPSTVPQPVCSSDSEESENNDPSCTNVLTTLAALAEATAPNASISTSEALKWLEMNGITMLPADNSTVVASALEGGQTVSLTEAGKLALRFVKKHQNINKSSLNVSSLIPESTQSSSVTSTTSTSQRVITIVADQARIPSIISSSQTPIVVLNNQHTDSNPCTKKVDVSEIKKEDSESCNGNEEAAEDESLQLKRELEKIKKEAELYKAQLAQKEYEAEQYRKQLEQIKTCPRVDK